MTISKTEMKRLARVERVKLIEGEWLYNDKLGLVLMVTKSTLKQWRMAGTGPRWSKDGPYENSRVKYRKADVLDWLTGQHRLFGEDVE